jgi:hypothetical protein
MEKHLKSNQTETVKLLGVGDPNHPSKRYFQPMRHNFRAEFAVAPINFTTPPNRKKFISGNVCYNQGEENGKDAKRSYGYV